MSPQQIQTIVIVAIVALLLAYRVWRQTREQRWPMKTLWTSTIIFAIITVFLVYTDTAFGSVYAPFAAIAGAAVGFGIGMYQGNHTTLRVDKPGNAVFIKVTPVGVAIFIGVLVLRIGLRYVLGGGSAQTAVAQNGFPIVPPLEAIVGSGLLAVALGSIAGLRVYVKRAFDAAPTSTT
jgi:uncharacterized membrane protein